MLALLLAVAITPSAVPPVAAPPDGVYHYIAQSLGQSVGKVTITVTHDGSTMLVREVAVAKFNGAKLSASSVMTLGANLDPSAYQATYISGGATTPVSVSLTSTQATEMVGGNNILFALQPKTTHFAVVDGSLLSGFFLLPAQLQAWYHASVTGIAPMYAEHGGPVTLSAILGTSQEARPRSVPATDIELDMTGPVPFTEWFDPKSFLLDQLDVISQGIAVIRRR